MFITKTPRREVFLLPSPYKIALRENHLYTIFSRWCKKRNFLSAILKRSAINLQQISNDVVRNATSEMLQNNEEKFMHNVTSAIADLAEVELTFDHFWFLCLKTCHNLHMDFMEHSKK